MLEKDKEWLKEHVIEKIGTTTSIKLQRTTMAGSATVEVEASVPLAELAIHALTLLDNVAVTAKDERREIQ